MTPYETRPDRNAPKAYFEPNTKADRIIYLVIVIIAIAAALI